MHSLVELNTTFAAAVAAPSAAMTTFPESLSPKALGLEDVVTSWNEDQQKALLLCPPHVIEYIRAVPKATEYLRTKNFHLSSVVGERRERVFESLKAQQPEVAENPDFLQAMRDLANESVASFADFIGAAKAGHYILGLNSKTTTGVTQRLKVAVFSGKEGEEPRIIPQRFEYDLGSIENDRELLYRVSTKPARLGPNEENPDGPLQFTALFSPACAEGNAFLFLQDILLPSLFDNLIASLGAKVPDKLVKRGKQGFNRFAPNFGVRMNKDSEEYVKGIRIIVRRNEEAEKALSKLLPKGNESLFEKNVDDLIAFAAEVREHDAKHPDAQLARHLSWNLGFIMKPTNPDKDFNKDLRFTELYHVKVNHDKTRDVADMLADLDLKALNEGEADERSAKRVHFVNKWRQLAALPTEMRMNERKKKEELAEVSDRGTARCSSNIYFGFGKYQMNIYCDRWCTVELPEKSSVDIDAIADMHDGFNGRGSGGSSGTAEAQRAQLLQLLQNRVGREFVQKRKEAPADDPMEDSPSKRLMTAASSAESTHTDASMNEGLPAAAEADPNTQATSNGEAEDARSGSEGSSVHDDDDDDDDESMEVDENELPEF